MITIIIYVKGHCFCDVCRYQQVTNVCRIYRSWERGFGQKYDQQNPTTVRASSTTWFAGVARGIFLDSLKPALSKLQSGCLPNAQACCGNNNRQTPSLYNFWFSTPNYLSCVSSFLLTASACVVSHRWIYCLSLPFHTHTHTHTQNKCRICESATVSTFQHRPGSSAPSEFCRSSSQTRVPFMSPTRAFLDTQACGHCLVPGQSSSAKLISQSDGPVHPPSCLLVRPLKLQPIHTQIKGLCLPFL